MLIKTFNFRFNIYLNHLSNASSQLSGPFSPIAGIPILGAIGREVIVPVQVGRREGAPVHPTEAVRQGIAARAVPLEFIPEDEGKVGFGADREPVVSRLERAPVAGGHSYEQLVRSGVSIQ